MIAKAEMRERFEEWARDAQELDTHHKETESPLDKTQYESWVTALAWEAWAAATYDTWSLLMEEQERRIQLAIECEKRCEGG